MQQFVDFFMWLAFFLAAVCLAKFAITHNPYDFIKGVGWLMIGVGDIGLMKL